MNYKIKYYFCKNNLLKYGIVNKIQNILLNMIILHLLYNNILH